jgi:hypothetical protein
LGFGQWSIPNRLDRIRYYRLLQRVELLQLAVYEARDRITGRHLIVILEQKPVADERVVADADSPY